MSININKPLVNSVKTQENKNVEIKQEPKNENKKQLKEHCSSKAGKALRGLALGLMLAAGVAAGAKSMPVKASSNDTIDSQTCTMQEAEINTEKTDIEMAVDEAMNQTTSLYVGNDTKVNCKGDMTGGERNYECSSITDGSLCFYDETTHTRVIPYTTVGPNGQSQTHTRVQTNHTYTEMNRFNLGTEKQGNGNIILEKGTRFDEVSEKNGDYVILAEDGKTFLVYNSEGKEIGKCTYQTTEEHDEETKDLLITTGVIVGGIAVAKGASEIAEHVKDKHRHK